MKAFKQKYDERAGSICSMITGVSSNKETNAFIVRSEEFAQMMKTQWLLIWQSSKPIKQKPSGAIEKFLKEI